MKLHSDLDSLLTCLVKESESHVIIRLLLRLFLLLLLLFLCNKERQCQWVGCNTKLKESIVKVTYQQLAELARDLRLGYELDGNTARCFIPWTLNNLVLRCKPEINTQTITLKSLLTSRSSTSGRGSCSRGGTSTRADLGDEVLDVHSRESTGEQVGPEWLDVKVGGLQDGGELITL